jgi:hypothetical protein
VYPLQAAPDGAAPLAHTAAEIRRVQAPVRVAEASDAKIRLAATNQSVNTIRVEAETTPGTWIPVSGELDRGFDSAVISNHFWGVLFSWILVSLGAPFWYDALKNLLKFRSLVAQKEDKNREERNTTQVPPKPRKPAQAASAGAGGGSQQPG